MMYAEVENIKQEAAPGLKGICPRCREEVIAKCGEHRIWHWAHKSKNNCDSWKENETEWHRMWKNFYDEQYREVIFQNGEKHIADIYINKQSKFVIEFQHSAISDAEKSSREKFYTRFAKMIWIIDGTRLKTDKERFGNIQIADNFTVYFTDEPENTLPRTWKDSEIPVFVDFYATDTSKKTPLYCIIPKKILGYTVIAPFSREEFIDLTLKDRLITQLTIKLSEFKQFFLETIIKSEKDLCEKRAKGFNFERDLYSEICTF